MSKIPIVRRTIISNKFNGDPYLSKKEFILITKKPEPKTKEKVIESGDIKPEQKTTKKQNIVMTSKELKLNNLFKLWLRDNIQELKSIFTDIVDIYNKNNAFLIRSVDDVFKEFVRDIFYNNMRKISSEYES